MGNAMCAIKADTVINVFAVGDNHTTLTCRDMLNGMEGEYGGISKLAIACILLLTFAVDEVSTRSMASILDNPTAIFICYPAQFLHIVRITGKVNNDNALIGTFRSVLQYLTEFIAIHEISIRIYIAELHIASTELHTVGTGGKGQGCYYHIYTRFNAKGMSR